jgi:hypothetical protein
MTEVITQVLWDRKAAYHGWLQAGGSVMPRRGYLQRWLHGVAAAEMVD